MKGILLVNLGSPDSTNVPDVRRYLDEFLSDPRVLDINVVLRQAILKVAILPTRPKESAHAYQTIWTDEGSPLIVTSQHVKDLLQERLEEPVFLAMRYGNPSIPNVLRTIRSRGVTDLLLIPLYPHYAMSSYETVVARVQECIQKDHPHIKLRVQNPFYKHPTYIEALAASMKPHLDEADYDHILFSYHGIPERHLKVRDPSGCYCLASSNCCDNENPAHSVCYRAQVMRTTREVTDALNIPKDRFSVSFQSRLGRDPWLKPYTDKVMELMPKRGIKKLLVVCPAFVSDCLETLEEIAITGKEDFLAAGGESFKQIPCLNTHPKWIDTLEVFVREHFPKDGAQETPNAA